MDAGKSKKSPKVARAKDRRRGGFSDGGIRGWGFSCAAVVGLVGAALCLESVAEGQSLPSVPMISDEIGAAPIGPGSYVAEPPHCLWPRLAGEKLAGLVRHPQGAERGFPQAAPCEPWLSRPYSLGWFGGMMSGGELLEDWTEQRQGFFTGGRFGYDLDAYWGVETRLGWSWMRLADSRRARDAQQAADDALGIPPGDPYRDRFDDRDAELFLWDVDLVYYPCGDVPLRPYGMIGFGLMHVSGVDRLDQPIHEMVHTLPLAVGLKHRPARSAALRLELADTIGFGDELETLHNVSVVLGIEFRFGGAGRAYWPWAR